jgi:hypothetical protein
MNPSTHTIASTTLAAAALCAATLFPGCAANPSPAAPSPTITPPAVPQASPERRAQLLGRVEKLIGTWEGKAADGQTTRLVFEPTAKGSAVREIMFPGTPMEMTNMYTMDGNDLAMTHYCAIGNQPKLRCRAPVGNTLPFAFDGVSNFAGPGQHYMAELTLVMKDDNTLAQVWRSYTDGVPYPEPTTFEFNRVK